MRQFSFLLKRKVMPLLLAGVMIFDISSYSFAQFLPQEKKQEQKVNYILKEKYQENKFWNYDFTQALKDSNRALERARQIKDVFKPSSDKGAANNNGYTSPLSSKEFNAQYAAAINKEYRKALNSLNTEKEKAALHLQTALSADPAELARQQEVLAQWTVQNKTALANWQASAVKTSKAQYATYIKEFKAQLAKAQAQHDAEMEQYLHSLARELMAIYKKYPSGSIKNIVLEVSPVILMLKKDGKDLFTQEEKNTLKSLYLSELKNNKSCDIIVTKRTTTWTTVNSPTVGSVGVPNIHTEHGLRSKEGCDILLNCVVGLGMIGQGHDDAYAIVDFMEKNAQTSIAVPSMLIGASALMAMKEYSPLRGFVAGSVSKENEGQMYFPSLTDLVDIIAYNRSYLGEVSRYTQYPLGNGAMGNGWEDLAYLLADDNTPQSLEILKSFAFNCTVFPGDFLASASLSCTGIRPFLLGAVLSKANVANSYQPGTPWAESRQYFTRDGHVITQTDDQINRMRRQNAWARANFNNFAKQEGIGKGAMLAKWLYASDMGDVNAETKLVLDNKIYKKYGSELAKGHGTAIVNYKKGDALYNAKVSKRQTVAIIRNVATVGDIALLIWGLWDIGRLGVQGYRMVMTLQRNMKMIRAGASIAERAVMIRRMGAAKSFIKLRSFGRNVANGARFVTGVKAPVISMDSFLTGMPKPVVKISELAKIKAAAPAAVGLTELTATTTLGKAVLPAKRSYQEIYMSVKGIDPFAPGLKESKTLSGAKLITKSGAPVEYNKLELRPDGLLEVDGLVQGNYSVKMPIHDLDFFISRLHNQSFYKYLHFDGTLKTAPSKMDWVKKLVPAKLMPNKAASSPISLEVYDALGRPMNVFVRIKDTNGMYAELAKTRRLTLRGSHLLSGEKIVDLNLTLPKTEFAQLAEKGINFSRLPSLDLIYTKTKSAAPLKMVEDASAFNKARLYAADGKAIEYSNLGLSKEGFLTVDGEIQKVFKAGIEDRDFGSFVSGARKQGYGKYMEFKAFLPEAKRGPADWFKNKFITTKEKQFGVSLDVVDNLGNPMNATLKFDSSYGLHRSLADAGQITFRGGNFVIDGKVLPLKIGVPKNQLTLMKGAGVDFAKLPPMMLNYSKSKMGPLYLNMALSFSAASSGLYFPLTNDPYKGHVSNFEISLITIGLPYGLSLLSPFASGVVSKLGAAKTQMLALSLAAGGLGVAAIAGFRGQSTLAKDENGKIIYDANGAPRVRSADQALPLWPLYTAAAITGGASALGRASLSVLNKQLEVGNSMLKGMAMKNIGGLAMIIPPAAISLFGGEVDFSSSFPVLAGISMFTVGWMKVSKYADNINKIPGFKYNFVEAAKSFKVMGNSSVLPYVAAFTMYSGYEGQTLFKTAAGLSKANFKDVELSDRPSAQKNLVAFLSGAAIAVVPAATRWFAPKKVTNFSPYILRSVGASALGGTLMYMQDDPKSAMGWVGAGLVGYGTANMYVFLQKSMLAKLQKNFALNPEQFYTMQKGVKVFKPYKQVETEALTAYTTANMGLAIGQQVSSVYADYRTKKGDSSWDANRHSLWIPGVMLLGGTAIAARTKIITMPKLPKFTLPKVAFPAISMPRGAFGLPYAAYTAGQIANGNYPTKNYFNTQSPAISMPPLQLNLNTPAKVDVPVTVQEPQLTPLPQEEAK